MLTQIGIAGYSRSLAAVGRGSGKYSEICSQSGQRIEQPLETLVQAGLVRRAVPVGAPKAAKPIDEKAPRRPRFQS